MSERETMVIVSVGLLPSQVERLKVISTERGTSVSELVREALTFYFGEYRRVQETKGAYGPQILD